MDERGRAIVRFADFRLDLRSGELWNGSERIVLPDQPFRILATLIRHKGDLISRDALRHELWADDTFVDFERGLNAAIKRLREMLGDSATAPRFIETIPRRGYRFIAMVADEVAENPVLSIDPAAPNVVLATTVAERGRWHTLRRLAAILVAILVTAGLASAYWLRGTPGRSPNRLVRLTSTAGLNVDPALSADGSLLAFASDRSGTGNLDIWLQRAMGEEPVRLTTDTADDVEPSFSPDGASIVFARRETGGIYIVSTHGGEPRLLVHADRANSPRFSPDGRSVAYWTGYTAWIGGPNTVAPVADLRARKPIQSVVGALFVVPSGGGSPRALAGDFVSARYGVWSADGGHLLFLGERVTSGAYSFDWYVVRADGRDPTPSGALAVLQRAGVTGVPIPAAWTASGDVVFTTAHQDTANVWQVGISPTTGRVNGVPRRLTFGTAIERDPAISSNGHVAFASLDENVDVWRLPLDMTSGLARGALERLTDDVARDELQNVTSDGRLVAFRSSRTQRGEIWLKDLRTSQERQLTYAGAGEAMISPDGSVVAVNRPGRQERVELYPSIGGPPSTLCEECGVGGWSSDGTRMLIGRRAPLRRRLIIDIPTHHETELLVHASQFLNNPRFTRDGSWVAFHVPTAPDTRQIYAVPSAPVKRVLPEQWIPVVSDFGMRPSWTSDGAGVYHFSDRDGYFCAWLQRVNPATKHPVGEPQAVLHLHQPTLRAVSSAMATNDVQGGYLYMTLTATTGNIWMLDRADE